MKLTTKEQVDLDSMSDDELVDLIIGNKWERIDSLICSRAQLLWRLIHWQWLCPECGRYHIWPSAYRKCEAETVKEAK